MHPRTIKNLARAVSYYCTGRLTTEQALARISKVFYEELILEGKMLPEAMEDAGYEYEVETGKWVKPRYQWIIERGIDG